MRLGCHLLISEALDIQLLLDLAPTLFRSSTTLLLLLPVYPAPPRPVPSSEVVP